MAEVERESSVNNEQQSEKPVTQKMKLVELRAELKKRNLKTSGNKGELRKRLQAALTLEEDDEDDEDDEDGEDGEDDEDDNSHQYDEESDSYKSRRSTQNVRRRAKYVPSFKDVEESLTRFSGDDKRNINLWIEEFEETAKMCEWVDIQKVMYAKRLLQGSAKLYVRFEKCSKNWKTLKRSLSSEFGNKVSSHKVHCELRQRTKRDDETYQEYLYKMLDISSQADVDVDSVMRYVIDGIRDEEMNKTMLYGATSIVEFKKKLEVYEEVKNKMKMKKQSGSEMKKRVHSTTSEVKRCFNCGRPNHVSADCPKRDKGLKCFKCNKHGHIAPNCTMKADVEKTAYTVEALPRGRYCKEVTIAGHNVTALIDTGSEFCLMRMDVYQKIGMPPLQDNRIRFRGVGSGVNETLGEFSTEIIIDGDLYPIVIHVVPIHSSPRAFIIGQTFMDTVDTILRTGEVSISKREVNSPNTTESEILAIDAIHDVHEIDTSYITNTDSRLVVENLIASYNPVKELESGIKMKIILKDDEPVYQRARRLSQSDKEIVQSQIKEWLSEGIIRPSLSEYASPIVLVKKKNGQTRICVDYRLLNKKIVKDRFPLPLIEDQLDLLQGATVFTTLDLRNGFFHVDVDADSMKYTAFIVPNGQYEFLKVPFGLCNSPAIFQKFINYVFRDQIAAKRVLVYMDDLIIPSEDHSTGLENLENVLDTASKFGLLINWSKCRFMQTKVEYLGHIVESGNIYPSGQKTDAVMRFPKPTNVKSLQSFLGLTGYFRKFVNRYSVIARPLTDLLRANVKFNFGPDEEQAFEHLKNILCSGPVLKIYKLGAETELHTDACMYGYGAILLQRDDVNGALHPVYYASGRTNSAEEKYTSYELEVLAIIKSLKKFRVYLLGIRFKIITDCQAFSMTMRKKDLCVRVARWALLLEEFSYTIEHRPGKNMRHVDALSRNALPTCMYVCESDESVIARLRAAQSKDVELRNIVDLVRTGGTNEYLIKDDLLFKVVDGDMLIVVPKSMQSTVVRNAHEKGHFSVNKTEALIRRDYWFRNMRNKIENIIRNCINCILAEKKQGKQEGFLNPLDKGDHPLDTFHIDHLGPIPSTRKNYKYIFAVIDAFTKFVWLYATKTTSTSEVINWLKKQGTLFGNPRRIISDRGTAFTSSDFENYCKEERMQHVLTTTGIPRANGQIERINRTLIPLLTKLSAPRPHEWYRYLTLAQQYLNATPNRSTGATPFNLLFGTKPRFKDDPQVREMIEREWELMFNEDRNELRQQAKENILKLQQANKKAYDAKRKSARRYMEDDLVAIRRTQLGPGLKFAQKYLGPYQIIKALRNDRYIVRRIGKGEGPQQTSTAVDSLKPWIDDLSDNCVSDSDCENQNAEASEDVCVCQNDRV